MIPTEHHNQVQQRTKKNWNPAVCNPFVCFQILLLTVKSHIKRPTSHHATDY